MPGSSGKLYYLKDRKRNPRPPRRRGEAPQAPGTTPVDAESRWVARLLVLLAVYLVGHWLAVGLGLVSAPVGAEARAWSYAFVPADLAVAAAIGLSASSLLRRSPRAEALTLFSAGGLVFLSIVRLFQGILESDPTIGERLHTLASFGAFFIGSGAAMHALRMRRDA